MTATKLPRPRARAAARTRTTKPGTPLSRAVDAFSGVERELDVHREELAVQNDELRRANASLLTARDHYAQLYESSPAPYLTLDEAGRVVEANVAAAALLGVPRSALFGRCFDDRIAPSSRQSFRSFRQRVVESGERRHENVVLVGNERLRARFDAVPLASPSSSSTACLICISCLSDHARPGGGTDAHAEEVDLSDLVRSMLADGPSALSTQPLAFDLADAPGIVRRERRALEQMLKRFVTVAADAIGPRGSVMHVRTANVDLPGVGPAGAVVFEISGEDGTAFRAYLPRHGSSPRPANDPPSPDRRAASPASPRSPRLALVRRSPAK